MITEYFVRLVDEGQEYLAVTTMVDDPQYLALPYIKTYQYRKQPDAAGWAPTSVRRRDSGAHRPLAFGLRPWASRPEPWPKAAYGREARLQAAL